MESSYSYTTTNYSASSSSSSTHNSNLSNSSTLLFPSQYQQDEERSRKPPQPPSYRSALHSVRKNVITKKPIAPMPPTPPKVYKVDPVDFRDVVQRLTGAADLMPARLREVAPPPLSLSPQHRLPRQLLGFAAEAEEEKPSRKLLPFESINNVGAISPLGFSLSPSSLAWCSSILLSPGTLSSLEPSAVL